MQWCGGVGPPDPGCDVGTAAEIPAPMPLTKPSLCYIREELLLIKKKSAEYPYHTLAWTHRVYISHLLTLKGAAYIK